MMPTPQLYHYCEALFTVGLAVLKSAPGYMTETYDRNLRYVCVTHLGGMDCNSYMYVGCGVGLAVTSNCAYVHAVGICGWGLVHCNLLARTQVVLGQVAAWLEEGRRGHCCPE